MMRPNTSVEKGDAADRGICPRPSRFLVSRYFVSLNVMPLMPVFRIPGWQWSEVPMTDLRWAVETPIRLGHCTKRIFSFRLDAGQSTHSEKRLMYGIECKRG